MHLFSSTNQFKARLALDPTSSRSANAVTSGVSILTSSSYRSVVGPMLHNEGPADGEAVSKLVASVEGADVDGGVNTGAPDSVVGAGVGRGLNTGAPVNNDVGFCVLIGTVDGLGEGYGESVGCAVGVDDGLREGYVVKVGPCVGIYDGLEEGVYLL
mmetsp:Transcript_356/g.553  ORF Transcript_356/g.553 Transcript_356/m.553 type:complete len:157 (+) Transcript_356:864-1334(+)